LIIINGVKDNGLISLILTTLNSQKFGIEQLKVWQKHDHSSIFIQAPVTSW